jgi:serine/threonine protein kinase
MNIRLIDFGLSRTFDPDAPELMSACGSPPYAPPEMIRGRSYTKMCDIWSAGILLYAVTVGSFPFEDGNVQRIFQKIAYTEPIYPSYLSPELTDLFRKILRKNPACRITIDEIKLHPWYSQSECPELFKLPLHRNNLLLSNNIDREIVDQIAALDIDVMGLTAQILDGEYNDVTAIYHILSRDRVTDRVTELMQRIGPGQTPRNTLRKTAASDAQVTLKPRLAAKLAAAKRIGVHRHSDIRPTKSFARRGVGRQRHVNVLGNRVEGNVWRQEPDNNQ